MIGTTMTNATTWPIPGLVISCQAPEGSPLRDPYVMAAMARAAELAGAVGTRVQGVEDIKAVAASTSIPIIGILKKHYDGSEVYITATTDDVDAVADAGATIIALDASPRPRPYEQSLEDVVAHAHARGLTVMGDLAAADEAANAIAAGVDVIGTTLIPASDEDVRPGGPNLGALEQLCREYPDVPVVAEGRFATPDDVRAAFVAGATTVVIGRAVTDTFALAKDVVAASESPGAASN
jgi:N-acylglucosamine-6-phosphate 2-epimerase